MKRLISITLLITLLVLNVATIGATNIEPYYLGVTSATAMLTISRFGQAKSTVTVNLREPLVSASIDMALLKYSSSGWEEIASWSESYDTASASSIHLNKVKYVDKGIYKVTATVNVTTTAGTDTLYPDSISVTYP